MDVCLCFRRCAGILLFFLEVEGGVRESQDIVLGEVSSYWHDDLEPSIPRRNVPQFPTLLVAHTESLLGVGYIFTSRTQ